MEHSRVRRHVLLVASHGLGHAMPMLDFARKTTEFHRVTYAVHGLRGDDLLRRGLFSGPEDPVQLYKLEDGITEEFSFDPVRGDWSSHPRLLAILHIAVAKLLREIPTRSESEVDKGYPIQEPVDVVVLDFFMGGRETEAVCRERHTPYYVFCVSSPLLPRMALALTEDSPTCPETDPYMYLPPVLNTARSMSIILPLRNALVNAKALILNSYRGLEDECLEEFRNSPATSSLKIYCIGPFIKDEKTPNSTEQEALLKVKHWLDAKPVNSVIYAAFGTVSLPKDEQLKIVTEALLATGQPFIWSCANSARFCQLLAPEESAKLSGNFNDTESQCVIVPWAPQKMILQHPSVAVFLTHCGWNGVQEGLICGVPFVGYPLFGDQHFVAQEVVRNKAGIRLLTDGVFNSWLVPGEEIKEALEKVGGWGGRGDKVEYRENARRWAGGIATTWTAEDSSFSDFMKIMDFNLGFEGH